MVFISKRNVKHMKQKIQLNEKQLKSIILNSVKKILNEGLYNDDEEFWKNERDAEMNYDLKNFEKAAQQDKGTYQASSSDNSFHIGDHVVVHAKRGDVEGVISDFDDNLMTGEEQVSVNYEKNGETWTMICIPISKIEKI